MKDRLENWDHAGECALINEGGRPANRNYRTITYPKRHGLFIEFDQKFPDPEETIDNGIDTIMNNCLQCPVRKNCTPQSTAMRSPEGEWKISVHPLVYQKK